MLTQIANKTEGYVVQVLCQLAGEVYETWHSVMNFGDRQGDALIFKSEDLPKLPEGALKLMIKNYNKNRKFERWGFQRYRPQRIIKNENAEQNRTI